MSRFSGAGDVVGANLDPSHLMWMGADIPTVIRTLGDAIFHVHAKDIRINDWIAARDGYWTRCPSPNRVRAHGIT